MASILTGFTMLTLVAVTLNAMAAPPMAARRARAQQLKTACTCNDDFLLLNRLNMDEVTVDTLKQQLGNIAASAKATGATPMATPANQTTMRNTLNQTRATIQMNGGQSSQGETNGFCNASIVKSSTACMDEIAMVHETDVHVVACQADRKAGKTTAIGARAEQTMMDYANEEIRGYEREIARIREILRSLGCQQGWIGYIKYEQKYTMDKSNPLPASPARVSGSESHKYESAFTAKILFNGLKPSVYNYNVADLYQWTSNSTMKQSCTGALRQTPANQAVTRTSDYSQKYNWDVADKFQVNFDYDAPTGEWTLEFDLPGVKADGRNEQIETAAGNCEASADGTKKSSVALSKDFSSIRVSRRGTTAKNLDKIQITEQFLTGPNMSLAGGGTITNTGTLIFTFYKQ